ncbi:hypothetical protein HDU83_000290 [Entophlyctis luteolus]|nr:hypothetical protein HDU83_000290 [Entophlyctis luteolus]
MKVWEEGRSRSGFSTVMLTIASSRFDGFRAGQFVYVKVPEKTRTKTNTVTVVHSGCGRFARGLSKAVTARQLNSDLSPPTVAVDGPYGGSRIHAHLGGLRSFIFVAGGIGATPLLSIAGDTVQRIHAAAASGGSKENPNAAVEQEAVGKRSQVFLIWCVKHLADLEWAIDALQDLAKGHRCDSSICGDGCEDGPVGVRVLLHVTQDALPHSSDQASAISMETSANTAVNSELIENDPVHDKLQQMAQGTIAGVTIASGRPDFSDFFGQIKASCDDVQEFGDCAVFVSGPNALIDAVNDAATGVSDRSCLFHVFEESFEV